jgi:hypothetical protein
MLLLGAGVTLVLALGRARLSDDYGRHLGQVARQVASALDSYVYRTLIDVQELGRSPTFREAVAVANRTPLSQVEIGRLDDLWRAQGPLPPRLAALLTNPTSEYLADLTRQDPIYIELLLTDVHGRLVAASGQVSDYYQGDEDWWRGTFDDGLIGRVTATGVRWDESAGRQAIEFSAPVPLPGSEELGGVLKVVADSREMFALVGGLSLGATGQAMLLIDDGTIVFSREAVRPETRFFAADTVRERAAVLRGGGPEETTFFRADTPDRDTVVVGLAPSQLVATYPNLPWIVAVMQSEAELLAPVQALGWYLLAVLVLSVLAVLVFALWLSMKLAAPPIDADLHLAHHSPVMHVGATDDPILADDEET